MLDFRRVIELRKGKMFHLTNEMFEQLQPSHNYGLFPEALPLVLVLDQVRNFYDSQHFAMLPTRKKASGLHLFMPHCKVGDSLVIAEFDGSNAIAMEFFDYLSRMTK